ncbi:MAG TPA: translocation/assembly module TamB domain-containing protein [Vicinamibacterales bacterium]
MNWLKRIRGHKLTRSARVGVTVAIALLAAGIVVLVAIDLGPLAKPYAEKYGSRYLERPLHLGSLSIHLFSGRIAITDLAIDGVHAGDRPFFTAKRLSLKLDWTPALRTRPDFTISAVELSDWAMLVEKWPNEHNFPRFRRDDNAPSGPRRFTVTMRSFHGQRGQFTYEDHEAPWSVVCRNLDIGITNVPDYHGTATFTDGLVSIQDNVPMWAKMKADFVLDGPIIRLSRVDLDTDGAATVAHGQVDIAHWPEQTYEVDSRVRFPRMREIFFKQESWPLTGDGQFTGTFHLFKDGRDLSGTFTSEELGVYHYRFPSLYGALRWTPTSFDVYDAGAHFAGGDATFSYAIAPLGSKTKPSARFEFNVDGLDLQQLTDLEQLRGQRFAGSASWHNVLEWPMGRFRERHGDGYLVVSPPAGETPMTATLPPADPSLAEWGPFAPVPLPAHLPIAGEVTYEYGPDTVTFEPSRFVTERTHVTFEGSTAYGDDSRMPFHVTSSDWQESDQLLAGIITDFGSPTGPVAFGGRGEFDGVFTGPFRRPRVEGNFKGDGLRAFDTSWGSAAGHITVQNSYVTVKDAAISKGDSAIHVDGLFSIGYPRDDAGEEIDARFRVERGNVEALRHAFQIDDYPVTGKLSGEFHLTGEYARPLGFGAMTVDQGIAYGEPFEKATAALRFDGTGVRLDNIAVSKGAGTVTGAAFVGWDSTYSFDANGQRIPVDAVQFVQYPDVAVTGVAEFTASGNGTFDVPRNDVRFRVADLTVGDEPVGLVSGTLAIRGTELNGALDVASSRMALTGTGRISMTPQRDAELTFRFHDTSLDPYVRLFEPRLSPYTTAVASGSLRVVGQLGNPDRLLVDGTVDQVEMRLFDYAIRNAAPVRLTLDRRVIKVGDFQLVGDDTRLRVSGTVDLGQERIGLRAVGDANLGILQGFFKDVRGSGHAELTAAVDGPLKQPVFSGNATITAGRIRYFSLPNALDEINGTLHFDSGGIRLDDVSAAFGGGRVQFGGRIGFNGYLPGELNVTARGQDMNLRVPEGIRSLVDADLTLTGNYQAPTLGGVVTVKSAVWNRRVDAPGSIFDLASRRGGAPNGLTPEAAPTIPLKYDVQLRVPSTLRVENNLARMVANADLTLRGTYDHPVVFGHADIERGEVTFEGRRYRITRGSMEFTNPTRIEPFFDVEAETNVRVPGQTYRVTIGLAGTSEQLRPTIGSDPPLPSPADVLALLFSDARRDTATSVAPELRALQNPNQTPTDILTARATQALATPISSEVGKVVEQTFGVNTFQLTPSFIDPYSTENGRINPTARLTIGKRISDRVYLTFSRSLNTTINDQIVLLEIDQSDRVSWVLSQNEDQTYALEFRVRRVF